MAEQMTQAKCEAAGIDWSLVQKLVQTYGPGFAQLVMDLIAAWKSHPNAAAAGAGCDPCGPDLAAALKEAHAAACKACCATCRAMCAAGVDDDHG